MEGKPLELQLLDFRKKLMSLVDEYSKTVPIMLLADTFNFVSIDINTAATKHIDELAKTYMDSLAEAENAEIKEEAKADENNKSTEPNS